MEADAAHLEIMLMHAKLILVCLSIPSFIASQAPGQDALGDGHALDGNLSTRGTRNSMTSRSRSEQGRFTMGQNPLAGRGYQNAVGYNSNSDFQRANNEMAMYADSLYNNPWYWEHIGSLATSLVTSGGSGGLGREAANAGGGYYNPFFWNANASNPSSSRVDVGKRIGDFGHYEAGESMHREAAPGGVDNLMDTHMTRPVVYGIGQPNRFLRDDRRSSVLRSMYNLRDLNTDPDYIGVGVSSADIPVRYAASPLSGVTPVAYGLSHADMGLTPLDTARIQEDFRLGRNFEPAGQSYRPDIEGSLAYTSRITNESNDSRLENRTDATLNDLLGVVANRYQEALGSSTPSNATMLENEYRNVLNMVAGGYGQREAGIGQEPSSIAGIPDPATQTGFNEELDLPSEPPTPPTLDSPPVLETGELKPPEQAPMPLDKFGLILRHGQQVGSLAEEDGTRRSELILSAQEKLAEGEYLWAERRFNRALRLTPGHPLATAGLAHAQLGGGLYLSAALTLQSLMGFQPEMIDVVYSESLLPPSKDMDRVILELNNRLKGDTDRDRYAFLLAYIGHQLDNPMLIERGLDIMRSIQDDKAFVDLLETIWIPPPGQVDLGDEVPELLPLEPVPGPESELDTKEDSSEETPPSSDVPEQGTP